MSTNDKVMNMKSHSNMVRSNKKYQPFSQKRRRGLTTRITLKTIMEEESPNDDCWVVLEPKPLRPSAVKLPMYDGCFVQLFDWEIV